MSAVWIQLWVERLTMDPAAWTAAHTLQLLLGRDAPQRVARADLWELSADGAQEPVAERFETWSKGSNLFVNPILQQIRTLQPVAVDRTEQHGYVFRLKGAPDDIFRVAVRLLNMANSPASIVTTDDHEVFERIQESMASGERDWIDWSRGMGHEKPFESGFTSEGTSEILMRNQHQAWVGYMSGAL